MSRCIVVGVTALAMVATVLVSPASVIAHDQATIDRETEGALKALYDSTPEARELAGRAKGILVFPNIVKAGFIFGAQYGDGELLKGGRPVSTISPLFRTACRPAFRHSAMPCSS